MDCQWIAQPPHICCSVLPPKPQSYLFDILAHQISEKSGSEYEGPDLVVDARGWRNEAALANCVFGTTLKQSLNAEVSRPQPPAAQPSMLLHCCCCLCHCCTVAAAPATAALQLLPVAAIVVAGSIRRFSWAATGVVQTRMQQELP